MNPRASNLDRTSLNFNTGTAKLKPIQTQLQTNTCVNTTARVCIGHRCKDRSVQSCKAKLMLNGFIAGLEYCLLVTSPHGKANGLQV